MPRPLLTICVALLFLGIAPLPYGYYSLLRLVACATLALSAVVAHRRRARTLPTVFGILAVAFNPVIPVFLPREIWAVIDVGTAILLLSQRRFLTDPLLSERQE
jgi:hypothetical protein